MSFERQFCEKCGKINYCVDVTSLNTPRKIKQKWLCEFCFGFVYYDAHKKDQIRKIMIECGIEDIE